MMVMLGANSSGNTMKMGHDILMYDEERPVIQSNDFQNMRFYETVGNVTILHVTFY